jgi:hypothetical protein
MWSISPEPIRLFGVGVVEHEVLEQPVRQSRRLERLGEALAHQQVCEACLRITALPCHQRRHDRVDRGEVGIVPRRDDHHRAQRLARDPALEAIGLAGRIESAREGSSAMAIM